MRTIRQLLIAIIIVGSVSTAYAKTGNPGNTDPKVPAPLAMQYNGYVRNAFGIRALGTTGITFKHFNSRSKAFEAILGLGYNSLSFTGLSEHYAQAFNSSNVNVYYGLGGHAVVASDTRYNVENERFSDAEDDFGLGVDFIMGLEMVIPNSPIAISLDVKPFFEVATSGNAYIGLDPGLGVKIMF